MRHNLITEYRINKKGAECFRTRSYEEAKAKLKELNTNRPVHTMECRHIELNKYGRFAQDDDLGRPIWSRWSPI